MVLEHLRTKLKISKVERDSFRYTGIDIKSTDAGIHISMEDYVAAMQYIDGVRNGPDDELLNTEELTMYRRYVGQLLWLSEQVRPDLSFLAGDMSRRSSKATLKDLKKINKDLEKHVFSHRNEILMKPYMVEVSTPFSESGVLTIPFSIKIRLHLVENGVEVEMGHFINFT